MRMRRKKYLDERLDACGNVNLGWLVDYAVIIDTEGNNLYEIGKKEYLESI